MDALRLTCTNPYTRHAGVVTPLKAVNLANRLQGSQFPCGQCQNCRIRRAYHKTVRAVFEAQMWEKTVGVTLTYDDDNVPKGNELKVEHHQRFIKRLRSIVHYYSKSKIKFLMCGEYGKNTMRPHYHYMIFGLGIENENIFRKVWKKGYIYVGSGGKSCASYIAGYIHKGLTKGSAELNGRKQEFVLQSNSDGGLGANFVKNYATQYAKHRKGFPEVVPNFIQIGKKEYYLDNHLKWIFASAAGYDTEQMEVDAQRVQFEMITKVSKSKGDNIVEKVKNTDIVAKLRKDRKYKNNRKVRL